MSNPYPPVGSLFVLGRVLKAHGTDGRVRVAVEERFEAYLSKGGFVFLDMDGSPVPYRIAGFDVGHHQVLALSGVKHKEEADALGGKELAIPEETVRPRHKRVLSARRDPWDGYTIRDEASGLSFTILRTEEFPQQLMAVVDHDGRELLIPLAEDLIESVDESARVIVMRLPEGLTEL